MKSPADTDPSSPPRQRFNPWPVGILSFFTLFFALIVAWIVFATSQREDLVRPDYYEEEMRYQQQMERLARTQAIDSQVAVAYDQARDLMSIGLPAAHVGAQASGRIHFYRPSDAKLDYQLPLALGPDGIQRVDVGKLRTGLWRVRLEWSVQGVEYYHDHEVVLRAGS